MKSRILAAALVLVAATGAWAQDKDKPEPEKERHEGYWSSIFQDFFLGPEKTDEFRWHGRIAPGATLEIKGINGSVVAEPSTGKEIELVAVKRGRRHDPKLVEIAFAEHPGGMTVCALYPALEAGRRNECVPGKSGRVSMRNNDVQVEFTVKVPAGVSFVARTVNGAIRVLGLAANVEAYTVNGGVRLDAAGHASAETVNGSIRATLGKADWSDALSFRTVNGSVVVSLPASASTGVHVETVNGSIASDFAMSGSTRRTRRELTGTIGTGGRDLQVKTVNGSVSLRRAG